MGNKASKGKKKQQNVNTRGQPLGGGSTGQQLGSGSNLQYGQRKKLVQAKKSANNIDRKERILEVLDQADQRAAYDSNPNIKYEDQSQYSTHSQSNSQANSQPNSTKNSNVNTKEKMQSSVYMSDPSSREAKAAESRMKTKEKKSLDDRRGRTRDLLFGGALNGPNNDTNNNNNNNNSNSNITNDNNRSKSKSRSKSPVRNGNENDIYIASGGAAAAALNRLEAKKKKPKKMDDRKQRTIDLLHGDALKGDNYYEPKPQSQQTTNINENKTENENDNINANMEQEEEMDENESAIRDAFNQIVTDKAASKLLLRIIQDILKGKTNKVNPSKLDAKITHVLLTLGFDKTQMANKQGQMTDYLVCNDNAMSVMRYAEQEIYQQLSFSES